MENASKALLMAGGILIAIIILAVLVKTFGTISGFQKTQILEEEQAQLVAFNEQYTQYLGQYVYGTEVLTVKNKSDNNGKVTVIIEGETPWKDENKKKYNETTNSYTSETKYYKCTNITYDASTGRVDSITFKQINTSSKIDI